MNHFDIVDLRKFTPFVRVDWVQNQRDSVLVLYVVRLRIKGFCKATVQLHNISNIEWHLEVEQQSNRCVLSENKYLNKQTFGRSEF